MADTRYRINAKQSAKGAWALDITVEHIHEEIQRAGPKDDIGAETKTPIQTELLNLINKTIREFKADGKIMAGDIS